MNEFRDLLFKLSDEDLERMYIFSRINALFNELNSGNVEALQRVIIETKGDPIMHHVSRLEQERITGLILKAEEFLSEQLLKQNL